MARKKNNNNRYEDFLQGKDLPLLTLDNKWHQLFTEENKTPEIKRAEKELNTLIQRQGQLNNDLRDMKKLKTNLMNEIVENMEAAITNDSELKKKQAKNQKYIIEINQKSENYNIELQEIPERIKAANVRLMTLCMEYCYSRLKSNDDTIVNLTEWITETRAQLTQSMIKRDELQEYNANMYSYMHDLFGPELTSVFDIKYKAFDEQEEVRKGAFVNAVSAKSK